MVGVLFGSTPSTCPGTDANQDGRISVADLVGVNRILAAGPQGAAITFFGLAEANGIPLQTIGAIDGVPVYYRTVGTGFQLVIESRQGPSGAPPGTTTVNWNPDDPLRRPDLQVEVDRPLGDGSSAVCEENGGVPAVDPPTYGPYQFVTDAINDLGCRFPAPGTSPNTACTQDNFGATGFVDAATQVQFCLQWVRALAVPAGETTFSVRWRDVAGNLGPVRQLRLRIGTGPIPSTFTPTATRPIVVSTRTPTRQPTATRTGTRTPTATASGTPSATVRASTTATRTPSASPTVRATSTSPPGGPTPTATPTRPTPTRTPTRPTPTRPNADAAGADRHADSTDADGAPTEPNRDRAAACDGEPESDTHRAAHADVQSDSEQHPDADRYGVGDPHRNCGADGHTDRHRDADAHADGHPDPEPHADLDTDRDRDAGGADRAHRVVSRDQQLGGRVRGRERHVAGRPADLRAQCRGDFSARRRRAPRSVTARRRTEHLC